MKKRIALITHDTSQVGGLTTMTSFLHRVLVESGRYEPDLISLATSASDSASLRLGSPKTWWQGARIEHISGHGQSFTHVGVHGSEFEFQRYRPRRMLTEILRHYDLLQFVAGSPPWVCVAGPVNRPIFLWTATTTRSDRASQMHNDSLARRAWSSLMVPITERYERRALKVAHAVFALSEYTRNTVEAIMGPGRVTVAPCGVDTNLFHPAVHAKADYIVCVARFADPRKNVRLLLEAYAMLQRKIGTIPDLYLIGDPPTEAARVYLKGLGLAPKVRLIGPRRGEELAELFRNALFFVLSSDEEGLGIVIVEAMASGTAVVSTACGGPATAVVEGETGFLTPIGDAPALAGAMERLLCDSDLREQMGSAGRRVAEERFSVAAAGQVFLDRYDEVLEAQRMDIERAEPHESAAVPCR